MNYICWDCGRKFKIIERNFKFFVDFDLKKFDNLSDCECPSCGSKHKLEATYDDLLFCEEI